MGTTTNYSWPYPESTGLVKDGWEDIKDLATAIDTTASTSFVSKIKNIVSATYSTETDSSSTTYADTGLTATITPSSTANKIYIAISAPFSKNAGNSGNGVKYRIVRGATTIAEWTENGLATGTTINNAATMGLIYVDSPSTTSATTYKLQFANVVAASLVRICSGGGLATIQLMEFA